VLQQSFHRDCKSVLNDMVSYSNSNDGDEFSWTWNVPDSFNTIFPPFRKHLFHFKTVRCLWLNLYIHTHTHTHTYVFREHFFVVARRKNVCHSFGKETCREVHRETDKKHGRLYPSENYFYARHPKKVYKRQWNWVAYIACLRRE